jgi:phosphatidylethanolamine/phosphatidyl-N-methylethanolamine N-methyltransferase
MQKKSSDIRSAVLNYYYSEVYEKYLFSRSVQAFGISYFEKSVERFWSNTDSNIGKILEIGAGRGEHLPYVKKSPLESYICLDLRENIDEVWKKDLSEDLIKVVSFVTGDAENIPFGDSYFDRTTSTCLLHHVDDPIQVMLEVRRVTKPGGEIAFALPTDPGILNQFVKRFLSGPRMRKYSFISPRLIYALEHKNHVSGLLEFCKLVYEDDALTIHYEPFKIHSWNFNLLCVVHIVKSKISPQYDFEGRL